MIKVALLDKLSQSVLKSSMQGQGPAQPQEAGSCGQGCRGCRARARGEGGRGAGDVGLGGGYLEHGEHHVGHHVRVTHVDPVRDGLDGIVTLVLGPTK